MHMLSHIPRNSRLESYVSVIWEVIGDKNIEEVILPQGITEVVFNFADRLNGIMPEGSKIVQAPRCFIQGIHTHVIHSTYIGRHHLLGIRLYPHAITPLLGIMPAELNNTIVDLSLINPLFDRLWHQLAELNSFEEKVNVLERELPLLSFIPERRSQILSNHLQSAEPRGFLSVDELARHVCYSPRQLNRIVHDLFGISAEELTLYKKFVDAVKCMHTSDLSLTQVAYNAGFYDQAHFCRVFKAYTGMTPNQYKKQKSLLPFHILNVP
jgi:AraC-like DNA-binding protein